MSKVIDIKKLDVGDEVVSIVPNAGGYDIVIGCVLKVSYIDSCGFTELEGLYKFTDGTQSYEEFSFFKEELEDFEYYQEGQDGQ